MNWDSPCLDLILPIHAQLRFYRIYDSPLAKLFLSLSHARDYIFIAPHAETCGIYARIAQNATADVKLERVMR